MTTTTPARDGAVARRWQHRYAARLRISDTLVVGAAVVLAQYLRFGVTPLHEDVPRSGNISHSVISLVLTLLWLSALAIFRTRSEQVLGSGLAEYRRVVSASFWIFGFIAIASLLLKLDLSRGYLAVALPVGTLGLISSRWLWRKQLLSRRKRGDCMTTLIVIGDRDAVSELVGEVVRNKDNAYEIVGVGLYRQVRLDEHLEIAGRHIPILGDEDRAVEVARELGVSSVALAGPERLGGNGLQYLLWHLERLGIKLIVSPTASPLVIEPIPGYPLLQVERPQHTGVRGYSKRAFDVFFASFVLALASPVLLLAAALIKLTIRGPIIDREERVGRGGATFQTVKLRTVSNGTDAAFHRLSNSVGWTLRVLKVDQIPQLVNVLKGDMSVLGPPVRSANDVGDYSEAIAKPGIAGLSMKRFLDLFLVFVTMPLWLPLLITLGFLKLLADGFPLFYLSKRIGRDGVPFTVYKFRTMVHDPEFIQDQISRLGRVGFEAIPLDNPVYTKAGRIYERLQLVELPQLLNILKGDMSLIGYRPLPKSHTTALGQVLGSDRVAQRHRGAPGITGFAQLSGKSMLNNQARLEIEIAEARFFVVNSWLTCVKAYFSILLSTLSYVVFGSSERAIRLRNKYLFQFPVGLGAGPDPLELNGKPPSVAPATTAPEASELVAAATNDGRGTTVQSAPAARHVDSVRLAQNFNKAHG